MKVLILRFSSIGDIVLTTPVVRCLKKKFPTSEIHFATKKGFQSILQHNPYIHKLHLLEGSVFDLAQELAKENFDYVIDLHHNQRTAFLKYLLGAEASSFDKINLEKWLMVSFQINLLPSKHIVDRYLETCRNLEVENDGMGLDYFIRNEDEVQPGILGAEFLHGYIGWVIGAKQNTKKFPVEKIIKVLNKISKPVVLFGGKEDYENGERIKRELLNDRTKIFNACGQFSLNQSASLIKQAKLILTNDTGLMHIAAAFKKPIISFWGNTIPEFGMYPYYGKAEIPNVKYEIPNLNCRPCSKLGYEACPKGHFRCMNLLDEDQIVLSVEQFIRSSNFST